MKKIIILISACAIAFAACKKSYTPAKPDYVIDGIHDISLVNNGSSYISVPFTVTYVEESNAAQELVTLSLSGLPAGITIDPNWIKTGYPTFSTAFSLYDTTAAGAVSGTYPLTLTATGASTGKRTFTINLNLTDPPACTAGLVGKYNNCYNSCSGTYYKDSVYADPAVHNKLWFTNLNNTGATVYGTLNCSTMYITIPSQTVGGVTYHSNSMNAYSHYISGYIYAGTSSCSMTMN